MTEPQEARRISRYLAKAVLESLHSSGHDGRYIAEGVLTALRHFVDENSGDPQEFLILARKINGLRLL